MDIIHSWETLPGHEQPLSGLLDEVRRSIEVSAAALSRTLAQRQAEAAAEAASDERAAFAAQLRAATGALLESDGHRALLEERLAAANAAAVEMRRALEAERVDRASLSARLLELDEELSLSQQSAARSREAASERQGAQHAELTRQLAEERAARAAAEREATSLRAQASAASGGADDAQRRERYAAAKAHASLQQLQAEHALAAERADSAIAAARSEAERLSSECGRLREESGKLRAEHALTAESAEGAIAAARSEAEQLRSECGRLREESGKLRAEGERLRSACGQLQEEGERRSEECSRLIQEEGAQLRAEGERLRTACGKLRAEHGELRAERDEALVRLTGVAHSADGLREHAARGLRDAASARELLAAKQRELRVESGARQCEALALGAEVRRCEAEARDALGALARERKAGAELQLQLSVARGQADGARAAAKEEAIKERERAASEWQQSEGELRRNTQQLTHELAAARSELGRVQEQRTVAWEHNQFLRAHLRHRVRVQSAGKDSIMSGGVGPQGGVRGDAEAFMSIRARGAGEEAPLAQRAPWPSASPAARPASPDARPPAASASREGPAARAGVGGCTSSGVSSGGRLPPPSARMLQVARERLASRSR